jgi:hypothetical protein
MAIVITDAIEAIGLRPVSAVLANLRSFFRVEAPRSAGDVAVELIRVRRATMTGMVIVCVGLFGVLILPILLPIEIVRGVRVRRHNEAMMRRLLDASAPAAPGGYRDAAGEAGAFREGLLRADTLLAIDWTIWRDGKVCFAGTALGVVRGDEHLAPWFTVHSGPPPRDAIDAAGLAKALADLPLVSTRWEWELHDPFEAVERK